MPKVNRNPKGYLTLALALACLLAMLIPQVARCAQAQSDEGPRLLRVYPSRDGVVGRDAVVVLSFDRPMDTESVREAASFSPAVDFRVTGEAECLVVPANLLRGGEQYTFRLSAWAARDLEGCPCGEEVTVRFTTRDDAMEIEVPALSFSGEIVEGKDPQEVAGNIGFGVGQYPDKGRPGGGNLVLMAHASGQIPFPFNDLRKLEAGDEIRVRYGGRIYVYGWKEGTVVPETAMWILDPQPYPLITFFVCSAADGSPSPTFHPPYRYVVRAFLSGSVP